MQSRWTDPAWRAVVRADAIASGMNDYAVGMQHVLLALAAEPGTAGEALRAVGADEDTLASRVREIQGAPSPYPAPGEVGFTPQLRALVADGGSHLVTTTALLRLIISAKDKIAARALRAARTDLDALAMELEFRHDNAEAVTLWASAQPDLRTVLAAARGQARQLGHRHLGTEHVLLALMADDKSLTGQALRWSGVSVTQLRLAMAEVSPEPTTFDGVTPAVLAVVDRALSHKEGARLGGTDVLLALPGVERSVAAEILRRVRLDEDTLTTKVDDLVAHDRRAPDDAPLAERLGYLKSPMARKETSDARLWAARIAPVAVVLLAVLLIGGWPDALLGALAYVLLGRKWKLWVFGALATWLFFSQYGPVVVAAGVARAVVVVLEIMLFRPEPIDAPSPQLDPADLWHPRAMLAVRKGDRALGRLRPREAIDHYRRASLRPTGLLRAIATLRQAVALDSMELHQDALDHARRARAMVTTRDDRSIALIRSALVVEGMTLSRLGHYGHARTTLNQAKDRPEALTSGERVRIMTALADLERLNGRPAVAVDLVEAELARGLDDLRLNRRCLLALSHAAEEAGDMVRAMDAAEAAEAASMMQLADSFQEQTFTSMLGSVTGLQATNMESAESIVRTVELGLRRSDPVDVEAALGFGEEEGAGRLALLADDQTTSARAATILAEVALRSDDLDAAQWYAARAVVSLDDARYLLRSQRHRQAWSSTMRRAISMLLTAVSQANPDALLEVIENLRLQASPSTNGDVTATAPRGSREVPLASPQAILVGAQPRTVFVSLLAGQRSTLRIADVAAAVAGPCFWWGMWICDDVLFWGLHEPDGDTTGGTVSLAPGSPADEAIQALRQALPVKLPNEDDAAFRTRTNGSPLWHDRERERAIAHAAGAALLPDRLRAALNRTNQAKPVAVLIGPPAELGFVPWGMLHCGAGETDDRRLVESADWVLAPPVALLSSVAGRSTSPPEGLGLAVLDPSGDLTVSRRLAADIPDSSELLTGDWHRGRGRLATREQLSAAMTRLSRGQVAYFSCHCSTGFDALSAEVRLVLARPGLDAEPDVLRAYDLLTDKAFPMPAEVVLSACDSAGVSTSSGGEWLSIGPAALWAGADTAIVSVIPVKEDPTIEGMLIARASDQSRREPLAVDLWRYQRTRMQEWRAESDGLGSPMRWAGYAVLGRIPGRAVRVECVEPAPLRARLDTGATKFVNELGWKYEFIGSSAATTIDLACEVLEDYAENVSDGLLTSMIRQVFCADVLVVTPFREAVLAVWRRGEARRAHRREDRLSPELTAVIDHAARRSLEHGRTVMTREDVTLALLDHRCAGRRLLRLFRLARRPQIRRGLAATADWRRPTMEPPRPSVLRSLNRPQLAPDRLFPAA